MMWWRFRNSFGFSSGRKNMEETIVLYPAPAFHHLVSMVELGKLIHKHQPEVSITILVPSMPLDDSTTSSYITNLSHSQTFSFISLPPSNEPTPLHSIAKNALHALQTLQTMSSTSTILALVTSAPHDNLNTPIPTYCYFTSCASVLAFFLHFPSIHNTTTKSFHELNRTLFYIPGLPPIPASHMPQPTLHRDTPSYNYFLNSVAGSMLKSKGVIVNSFDFLESRAIAAITHSTCVSQPLHDHDLDQSSHNNSVICHDDSESFNNYPPQRPYPPVFCIGPLVTNTKDHMRMSHDDASHCLAWLDTQPRGSVVLLCFGSKGVFSEAQLREIAFGLEKSMYRFLWVVKSPQGVDTEPNLEELLPKGFLERTKERGLVVKTWVPQNAVLEHRAVGGLVTHCGWNSVLEAVRCGVPTVAWPLYAEQHMNSVVMIEEMKVAIGEMSCGEGQGLVGWKEVERRVRELMESEVVRQRCWEVKDMAKAAWDLGGSSATNFSKLVASWKLS